MAIFAERSLHALRWILLSCHFLSYSILRKSPMPATQSIYSIYVGRVLPAVDSFLRPDRYGTVQPNTCLLTYLEPR